jgi:beta-glucosidase
VPKEEEKRMSRKIKELINEMTLEEKAGLCSGLDFWNTKGCPLMQ